MLLPVIDIHSLADLSYLSATRSNDFSEAAAVCLDFHHQPTGVVLTMEGEWKERFSVSWNDVTQQMRDSRNDMDSTVESGAYCLAMLTLERCTGLKVIKQSQKRTGFDYWLGKEPNTGFQEMSRLEVSGILKGNTSQIHQRLKEKIAQTQKSDHLNIPAFIAIVEFSLHFDKSVKALTMKNISPAIDEMHQKAMQLADEALSAKMRQELDDAQSNYLAAFQYESAAAMLLVNDQDMEPTRSILFRSAACLLLNLPFPHDTHFRQAERMVAFGLSGNPPEAIADELREVWRELIQYLHKEAA